MNFKIVPYTSVGSIKFGETREKTRNTMGNFKEYKKTKFSKNTLDDFSYCHVFYTTENLVEAVEMFNDCVVDYKGKNLFSLTGEEIKALLHDPNAKEEGDLIDFPSVGLSVSLKDDMPDSILAFAKGYL